MWTLPWRLSSKNATTFVRTPSTLADGTVRCYLSHMSRSVQCSPTTFSRHFLSSYCVSADDTSPRLDAKTNERAKSSKVKLSLAGTFKDSALSYRSTERHGPKENKQQAAVYHNAAGKPTGCVWLRIIHFSDVYELDAFPRLKTLIDCHKDGPDATLVVVAGDFLAPSLLSSLDKGAGMVDCLNAIGVTHVCFGNHEADVGIDAIKDRLLQSKFCWINTNIHDLDNKIGVEIPECEIVTVSNGSVSKNVGLVGLLTHNPGLYSPGAFGGAYIEPILTATEKVVETYKDQVDVWIPLTHQGIAEDRAFAAKFTGNLFPVILGSHDHDLIDENVQGSRILQTGMDAENAAIIDLKWITGNSGISNSQPELTIEMLMATDFAPDAVVAQRIKGHQKILQELEQAPLFRIQEWIDWAIAECNRLKQSNRKLTSFSTQNNRLGPSSGTTALCSMLRMGMFAQCALINAGAVRANKIYNNADYFTWSDLKAEILFPTHMTACYIPGEVLEATIAHSRAGCQQTPAIAKGGYLHTCNHIVFNDEKQCVESVNGQAFDPNKHYLTALPTYFFEGIDHHEPLLEWASEKNSK